ncbi:MAG: 2-dehydropantoate 2-reductase [Candidatus Hydrogenedentes bacterium]|nr:2-dehydropantoate 2-reductase [Candidatus Hydrogenedentota bacterium]
MKVSIVGPGAMGCLFAARLEKAGINVTLVDYRSDRAGRLRSAGITVETSGEIINAKPEIALRVPERQDLVITLTKGYSLRDLRLPPDVIVLTLQNGLGNVEALCSVIGSARVLAGVTTEASTLLSEGHVRHVAGGVTRIGSWTSASPKNALAVLAKAGFEVESTDSPGQMIWEKAAINAGINPLTAILGVPNGKLLQLSEARQIMRDLVVEAVKVAATEGYRFNYSMVEKVEEVCRETGENISSMLQDIRAGRMTESDALSGEILRRGQLANLPTPRTRMVWQLIKSLEQR